MAPAAPAFVRIKAYLLAEIEAGRLPPGARIPSENELARRFQVVRMTANRAVVDLARDGVLRRTKGLGTFVSERRYESTLVEIRSIDAEIEASGCRYSAKLLRHRAIPADPAVAAELELPPGSEVFATDLVHLADGSPLQLERRYVNPEAAPGYLDQDFNTTTPTAYLLKTVPLQRAEYRIRAESASTETAAVLAIAPGGPTLVLWRRTWQAERAVTTAELHHPADRFTFSGSF